MVVEALCRIHVVGRQRGAGAVEAIDGRGDVAVASRHDVEARHVGFGQVRDQTATDADRNLRRQARRIDAVGQHQLRRFGDQLSV